MEKVDPTNANAVAGPSRLSYSTTDSSTHDRSQQPTHSNALASSKPPPPPETVPQDVATTTATTTYTTVVIDSSNRAPRGPRIIPTLIDSEGIKVVPNLFEQCQVDDLIALISSMLDRLIQHNDRIPLTPSSLTRFHSRAPPSINVKDYLLRIARYTNVEPCCLLILLPYVDKVCTRMSTFTISSLTVHRFIIAGVSVGSKALSDSFCTNGRYARVGGVSIGEMNLLEKELCEAIDWRLTTTGTVLAHYYSSLVTSHPEYRLATPLPTSAPITPTPDPSPSTVNGLSTPNPQGNLQDSTPTPRSTSKFAPPQDDQAMAVDTDETLQTPSSTRSFLPSSTSSSSSSSAAASTSSTAPSPSHPPNKELNPEHPVGPSKVLSTRPPSDRPTSTLNSSSPSSSSSSSANHSISFTSPSNIRISSSNSSAAALLQAPSPALIPAPTRSKRPQATQSNLPSPVRGVVENESIVLGNPGLGQSFAVGAVEGLVLGTQGGTNERRSRTRDTRYDSSDDDDDDDEEETAVNPGPGGVDHYPQGSPIDSSSPSSGMNQDPTCDPASLNPFTTSSDVRSNANANATLANRQIKRTASESPSLEIPSDDPMGQELNGTRRGKR